MTRALTDGRLTVDRSTGGRGVISAPRGPYVFRFGYRDRTAKATIKPGHVREEFVMLGAKKDKSPGEVARHEALKPEMANRLLPLPAEEIYDVRVQPKELSFK
ncbi:hypothetical protein [Nitratireductor aquibiodomus]|uniref:hypothetical protein n=1 Tax=Nitratireductor aquibiodomus TaxID=204799 RepID=UPI00068796E5|nr:hypothetical protein [Nitratireductor aquibiodomus]